MRAILQKKWKNAPSKKRGFEFHRVKVELYPVMHAVLLNAEPVLRDVSYYLKIVSILLFFFQARCRSTYQRRASNGRILRFSYYLF